MAHDDTRGRRGFESRGRQDDRPYGGFQKRERDTRPGQPSFGGDQRERTPWRGERGSGGSDTRPGRSARPPFARETREEGWTPFHGRGERDGERRPSDDRGFRPAPEGERPPFREQQRYNERPPFRSDRPSSFENRGDNDRPWQRERRDEGRPSFADRGQSSGRNERPTYRQGRGGYRPFDQDLPHSERPQSSYRGDRPFQGRRDEGDRGFRRPDGDRPAYQDRRPSYSSDRPFERREADGAPFADAGRPLGTVTRAGRSPVSQFERIQADVYGRWPVLESLRAGNVAKIYIAAGVRDSADHLQEIQAIAAEKHVTIVRVDRFDLDRVLGNVNHQGIAAACRPYQYTDFEDIVAAAGKSAEKPLIVLFDGVQDPQNVGSILRTGEAVGIDGAVLPKHNQAAVTPAVVRASAGAVEHLPVAEVSNLRQSIATLKEAGYWIVGLDMEGGTDYDNFDVDSALALIVGGEGRGLSRMISEECDYLVRLPMRGKVGSLNASVAAGIVLYEIARRRGTAGLPKSKPAVEDSVDVVEIVEALAGEDLDLQEELEAAIDAGDAEGTESLVFEEIFEDESDEEPDVPGDEVLEDQEQDATDSAEENDQP